MVFFPIHRRDFFWAIMFFIVFLLTAINNYFFYKNDANFESRKYNQLTHVIAASYEACQLQNMQNIRCEELVKQTLQKANISGITRLTKGSELLVEIDNEHYKDNRTAVSSALIFGSDNNKLTLEITKLATPPLINSVVRSLTFSGADIIGKISRNEPISAFVTYVALPRSMPAFSFMLVVFVVFGLIRLKTNALTNQLSIKEKEINELHDEAEKIETAQVRIDELLMKNRAERQRHADEINFLQSRLDEAESNLDRQEQHAQYEISKHKNRITELAKENKKLEEESLNLEMEKEEAEKELKIKEDFIENKEREIKKLDDASEIKSQKRWLIDTLLHNPDVTLSSGKPNFNEGSHHSKGFVSGIADSIERNPLLLNLYRSVDNLHYGPKKRGNVELVFDNDKRAYALNIYDRKDAGYAAQVVLSAEKSWEAIIQAKCIISVTSALRNHKLILKV